jgi:LysR family glycine cleavage system transcriptional activator
MTSGRPGASLICVVLVVLPSRPPSFRTIATFDSAARHENFARAAAELNLTESAVSHAVKTLEEQLGARLFERGPRRVALTPEGARLAARLRTVLDLLDRALDLERTRAPDKVVVAAPSMFASHILLPAWREAGELRAGAGVQLQIVGDPTDLEPPDLCIGFGIAPAGRPFTRQLSQERLVPVAASDPTTALMRPAELDLIDNTACPWIEWFLLSGEPSPDRRPVLVTSSFAVAMAAARIGAGACLAPESLARRELAAGTLVALPGAPQSLRGGWYAQWRSDNPKAARIERFTDWLASVLGGAWQALTASSPTELAAAGRRAG